MIAVKENRVYAIDAREAEARREDGYDIYDEAGSLVAYSRKKTVPYEEYAALLAECERLRAGKKRSVKEG